MNLLVGAISGNYSVDKIRTWVESSDNFDCRRTVILYNGKDNPELAQYLSHKKVQVIFPDVDFWGNKKDFFEHHTGKINLLNSYDLIHNNRFLYINRLLSTNNFEKVLVTDVSDVRFTRDPFSEIPNDKLIATSEVITYGEEDWNFHHMLYNIGIFGHEFKEYEVLNVGVFGGSAELVKDISRDIMLLSVGKPKVADQTSYNYLIRTHYKDKTTITSLEDKFAVHLQVVVDGLVKLDYDTIDDYAIVHQYDRIKK